MGVIGQHGTIFRALLHHCLKVTKDITQGAEHGILASQGIRGNIDDD
jgi:hypothetical protein